MQIEQSPLDFEEGRREVFAQMIQATEETRERVTETIHDEEDRAMGLVACTRLIHQYRLAVTDWSPERKAALSEAEEAYMEMQGILFDE